MKKTRRILAALFALTLMLTGAAMAASMSVVTNSAATVYSSASTQAASVSVPKGVTLKLTDYFDSWGKVSYRGKSAYIQLKYLNLKKPVKVYLSKDATVYAAAGSGSLGTAQKGSTLYFLGMDGSYAHVTNQSRSYDGYVESDALTASKLAPNGFQLSDDPRIARTVEAARSVLGKRYALRSNPPSSFNCASFVHYCFNIGQAGSMGSTLGEQVHNESFRKIDSISELKQGDLVCFNISSDTDPYGHVGIYLGGGYFVHASPSPGKVAVGQMNSGAYRDSFSFGRRVFE